MTAVTPVPPTSPATALSPGSAGGALLPGSPPVSTLANGSVVTAQNAPVPGTASSIVGSGTAASGTALSSPVATGTPLSTRAPEPGVTCRVVK